MARCLISFGANIGNPLSTILAAAKLLQSKLCKTNNDFQLSRPFRTPPVGGPSGQSPFVNAVAAIETERTAWEVWHAIREIEHQLGRERNLRWEARRIDLDILLYDQQTIWTPHLKIPHPRMCMRRFILIPALDVASDWIDPVSSWSIAELAENVRRGPSNFVLVADRAAQAKGRSAEGMLAEVARRTGATWCSSEQLRSADSEEAITEKSSGRWLSLLEQPVTLESLPPTKLTIFLAPAMQAVDAAWEDFHQHLAARLNLSSSTQSGIFRGPRYLLAADDPDWAIQEMIAALEAMDCPVEVL